MNETDLGMVCPWPGIRGSTIYRLITKKENGKERTIEEEIFDKSSDRIARLVNKIWCQLGRCNGVRVHPRALETAYQWLKPFVYVKYGCMKRSEIDISLSHDVMTSFSLHK